MTCKDFPALFWYVDIIQSEKYSHLYEYIFTYFTYSMRKTHCHREILGASEKFSSLPRNTRRFVRNIFIYFIYLARNTRCHREILGASEKSSVLSEKYSPFCEKYSYLFYLFCEKHTLSPRNTRRIREILVAFREILVASRRNHAALQ